MLYFLFFLLGLFTARLIELLITINQAFKIWKLVEFSTLNIMAENDQWRAQALTILKLCYEEANRLEEYEKLETVINSKYSSIQDFILAGMKGHLPYNVNYNNLNEAIVVYKKELLKLNKREQE